MNTKKILFTVGGVFFLLLISGYVENSYCHFWTTQSPIGSPIDYIHTTGFCYLNQYPGLLGGLILSLFGLY